MSEEQVTGGTRRVFKQGDSLCVVLPHEFVKRTNIKEGDTLSLAWTELVIKFFPLQKPVLVGGKSGS